jgi:endonuclease G
MKKLLFSLLLVSSFSYAGQCDKLYPNSQPIVIKGTTELCNSFFVSLFDKQKNEVVLVAEHLKPNKNTVSRKDAFRSDDRIGKNPSPTQYVNTGFDKGHMAPAGDSSNEQEMYDTFLMTNMTPQEPTLNRKAWRILEEKVRTQLSNSTEDFYILNIAVYADNKMMGSIPVPTGYWKVVIHGKSTEYYYADNKVEAPVTQKQVASFVSLLPK